jgi:DNA-binding LacI/PurR family transcriptional regulator
VKTTPIKARNICWSAAPRHWRGHDRLAKPSPQNLNAPQNARLQGFRRAMAEFDQTLHSEWLFENPTFEIGGSEMAQHFLNSQNGRLACASSTITGAGTNCSVS